MQHIKTVVILQLVKLGYTEYDRYGKLIYRKYKRTEHKQFRENSFIFGEYLL